MDSITKKKIVSSCDKLLQAYNSGLLTSANMPEDVSPKFTQLQIETMLVYFTLPMSLNYQRNSYKLWESVFQTYQDEQTNKIFDIKTSANLDTIKLRQHLLKYKLALQPTKHIHTWQTIAKTIYLEWGSMQNLLSAAEYDYLKLKQLIQVKHKKGFPYLSGPKIFNYWCFILMQYCHIDLKHAEFIEIAPDTHVIQCSIRLGVISKEQSISLTREQISQIWRDLLSKTNITPIQMHSPLWFWSRDNFAYKVD
jgi:hypothetical protein